MRRALVIGSEGQDGRLLSERLRSTHEVVGLDVGSAVNLDDAAAVAKLCAEFTPDEVYYLAAHHHSSEEQPDESAELRASLRVHVTAFLNVLDGLRAHAPSARIFYAGSSHMFGAPERTPQDETVPFAPRNAYAITKVAAANACALFRRRYGTHVSVGILYNHESPLRGPKFVTQRIARGARSASRDPAFKLKIGSLSSVVDWGWAPDYVDAMTRIVAQDQPDDYVIATGEPHTVKDFVEIAFGHLGLDWRKHVEESGVASTKQPVLVGDATKLRTRTGWKPTVTFEEIVKTLVDATE